MQRTQEEVNRMWDERFFRSYYFMAIIRVTQPSSINQVRDLLQQCYDDGAMAGSFNISQKFDEQDFLVKFSRDCGDDEDVTKTELLAGKEFDEVLMHQFRVEFDAFNPVAELLSMPYLSKPTNI